MEFYEFYTKDGKEANIDTCNYAIIYKYLGDFEDYCEQEGIITDGLRDIYIENAFSPIVLFIDTYEEIRWHKVEKNDYPNWLVGKLAERKFVTHELANTEETLYNLYVIFKSGITLQTNTEPITFDDIAEAIEVLQKPSIFGKQIAEFKIEVL